MSLLEIQGIFGWFLFDLISVRPLYLIFFTGNPQKTIQGG